MAPPRTRAPESWTVIAIGLVVFALFQAGSVAAYAFFVFDTLYTCDRASDLCEEVHIKPFWRAVDDEFKPSQVVQAKYVTGKKSSWVVLEMAGGEPEVRLYGKAGEEFVARLNAFIAEPTQPRFNYLVEKDLFEYAIVVLLQLFSLIPLIGASADAMRRLRAR